MSAIRPLATIAMLMVLGYFLWTRINTPALEPGDESELALAEVPSLLDGADEGTEGSSAPKFSPSPAESSDSSDDHNERGSRSNNTAEQIVPLDLSAEDELPELPPLPDHVPVADYSVEASSADAPANDQQPPSAAEATADSEAPPAEDDLPSDLGATATVPLSPAEAEQQALAAEPPPADETPAAAGRYAEPPVESQAPLSRDPSFGSPSSGFAADRPAIERALADGELAEALLLLSRWYGDRTLTADEREEIESLLSQLAGTVIYSTEHRLTGPHRVRPEETLETIAEQYQVPWQLLAKINGVASPTDLSVGQELKVIRGPFSAMVDVERQQLVLMVANRYAGRFSVKTEGQATAEGEWVVTGKQQPGLADAGSKQLVLGPAGGNRSEGTSLVLGPTSDNLPPTDGAIRVGPRDQDDLFDILSIGSKVIIRK